ncbi:DNA replication/repair protein RecF [bacterium]|nr:DNA replication/repair protein RecF [bacterium]
MHLTRLTLTNFRVYEQLQLELQRGLSAFIGPNAAGKTSLLEAIHVLATTKSPRTNSDAELVQWGANICRIEGGFVTHDGRALRLAVGLDASAGVGALGRRLEVEGEAVSGPRDFIGRATVVMFTPDDLAIIKGGPGLRRRFLNTAIAQLQPRYLDDLSRYKRALRQRNELLKTLGHGARPPAEAQAWTEQLVRSGAAVAVTRRRFIGALDVQAREVHRRIAGEEELALSYVGELADCGEEDAAAEVFRARLEELGDLEVRRGTTLAGPHRDELHVAINDVPVRQFGSQGQQRTAALSLKLGQARVAQEWSDEPPLLLLDDCLSELDPARARAVLDLANTLDGLIVTTAKLDPVLAEHPEAVFYDIGGGKALSRGE